MSSEPSDPLPRSGSPIPWLPLLVLAAGFTLLNAVKPLHVDDPFIYEIARRILEHPLDPYGFDIFWLQWPQPVHEELTPPLLPYWWALILRVAGESTVAWKLGLFPFAALLSVSLFSVLRRFTGRLALPLVILCLFSPALLPGFNLMQDIPAQALGLTAFALYLVAFERRSLRLAGAAGIVLGLATQTKYTAVAILALILLHGLLRRRWAPAALCASLGLLLFAGWELFMTQTYGQGMFLGQVRHGMFWYPRALMIRPLVTLLGALLPAVALLGLGGLGLRPPLAAVVGAMALGATASLLVFPIEAPVFLMLGILVLGVTLLSALGLLRVGSGFSPRRLLARHPTELLLLGWLAIELAVYFAASPFPAVRRVLGVALASTVLIGRWAALGGRLPGRRVATVASVLVGLTLGLSYFLVDLSDADAQREAAGQAAAGVRAVNPDATLWFTGHWGFQFYAEQAGMLPVVPDGSRLEAGDWLVVPTEVDRQEIVLDPGDLELVSTLEFGPFPPVTTGAGYYAGGHPLTHLDGPRLHLQIYRARREFVARSSWSTARIVDWALRSTGRTAAAALPALLPRLQLDGPDGRRKSALALAHIGPLAGPALDALTGALADDDPVVRYWSVVALGRIGPEATRAVPLLRGLADDPSPEIRDAARTAIQAISP
jgi:hypothetical protein